MPARWYPFRINAKTQLLSASPTSIITVVTSRSYGIASLFTQLGVMWKESKPYRDNNIYREG